MEKGNESMLLIKEIEELNKKIDRLMVEKTKSDAQSEVWSNRLNDSIKEYNKLYGVDISGNSLGEIKEKLTKESRVVEEVTRKEFEQAQKIVALVEEGDYVGARKLAGEEVEEVQEPIQEVEEVVEPVVSNKLEGAVNVVEEMNEDDFYGVFSDEDETEKSPIIEVDESDEVEDEQPLGLNGKAKPVNPFARGVFKFDDEDEEEDEFVTPNSVEAPKKSENKFVMEDDEEDDFGGFGSILSGSKFKVE